MDGWSKKLSLANIACLFSVWFAMQQTAFAQSGSYSLSYSGRLTQADGAPLSGPVDVTVKFWSAPDAGNTLGTPIELTNIALNQGVFTIPLDLNPAQVTAVFGQGTDPVFIEIAAAGKTYPRQQYSYVPFALRIPVDGKTLAFDADGKLALSLTSQPSANQFLTKDNNGRLTWGSPVVSTLQGQSIANTAPTSGQILTYSGGQWVPQTLAVAGAAGGTVTNVSGTAPITVTTGTTTPVISMAQASGSANGYLSSADWTAFNSKPGAAVTSVATGTGLTGGPITSSGTISLSNTTVTPGSYTRANIAVDAQGRLTAAGNGSSVNLASEVSGTLPVGNGGTGAASFTNNGILVGSGSLPISTLNGSQYQVLTASAGGTPNFGSLNLDQSAAVTGILPRANGGTGLNSTATFPSSGVIVTEGATETLSNKTLNGALISASTVNGASLIGGSTTIDTAGTLKSGAATVAGNVTILGNSTTANKLALNDKGSTNSVALKAPDTLASSLTLELPSNSGSNGQVLATNGSGILSWVSAATGSVTTVTGTAPISIATGSSTPVISMSQANGSASGYLSSADWTTFNSKQAGGNYLTGLTGDVSAAGPGSGAATLAAVAIAGTSTKVTYDVKGRVTSGTSLEAADLPSHSAALITSGTLATANGGTGANLTSTGGAGQYLKQTTSGGSVTVGTIAASDITSSLGYTPLNRAGDTVTGALNLGANDLSNSGNILMAASKTLALSTNASDPSGLGSSDVGKTWFNSTTNQIKYWNGSAAIALGAAGSGLSNLNGQTGTTQTFAVPGTSGTAPTWSSASNAHTLNIPMASAASVTAGLLSNADYAVFTSKQPAGNYVTTLTGDVTTSGFSAGSATATLASVSPGGTSTKVTFDTKGRVTSGSTLSASDIPPLSAAVITSGTLTVANGGTGATTLAVNNVILGNGTSALQVVAPGTSGNVLTSNGTTWQSTILPSSVTSVTGTAPISVATGTSTPVISISQANGSTNGYLSSADWTTFSSKQAAGNYITALTGDVSASGAGSAAATLSATGVTAGTYTKVTVDAKGRVTASSTLVASDIPPLPTSIIGSGTLGVANGGTGAATLAANSVLLGNGTSALQAVAPGASGNVLTSNGSTWTSAASVANWAAPGTIGSTTPNTGAFTTLMASGNVGIGTTNPTSMLHLASAGSVELKLQADTNNSGETDNPTVRFSQDGGIVTSRIGFDSLNDFVISNEYASSLSLGTAGQARITINSNGNVGIGTTAPNNLLNVSGTTNSTTVFANQMQSWVVPGIPTVKNSNSAGIAVGSFETGIVGRGRMDLMVSGAPVAGNTWGLVPDVAVMSLLGNGNVGIGTTAPGAKLDVNGTIRAPEICDESGANCKDISLGWGSASSEAIFFSCSNAQSANSSNLPCYGAASNGGRGNSTYRAISCNYETGNYTVNFLTWTGSAWQFYSGGWFNCTDNTVRVMKMDATGGSYTTQWSAATGGINYASGNVGIGTTAPTAVLDVTGSANISGGVGTVIWSTQPGSRYSGMSGSWSPTGESLTITVPAGSSRRYRVVMRQTLFNNNICTLYVALSTSNTAPTSSNSLFMPGISIGAGYTGPVNAETYVTLAPGSYTYYVMAIFTGGSPNGSQVLNSTGDNRMYSDVFAVQM